MHVSWWGNEQFNKNGDNKRIIFVWMSLVQEGKPFGSDPHLESMEKAWEPEDMGAG